VLGVAGGIGTLTAGNLVLTSAYRIALVMPFYAILAAVALVILVGRGLAEVVRTPRQADLVLCGVLAVLAGYNLGYYFLDHIPKCRYLGDDRATAAVSMAFQAITREVPDAVIFTLTEPGYNVGSYPHAQYFSGRPTLTLGAPDVPRPDEDGALKQIYHLPPGTEVVTEIRRALARHPVALMVAPSRTPDLETVQRELPGGQSTSFARCGTAIVDVYLLPARPTP